MVALKRKSISIKPLLLLFLFLTGCSPLLTRSIVGSGSPTEVERFTVTALVAPTKTMMPTRTITPTLAKPTSRVSITPTAIPPSETPTSFPLAEFHTELSSLPKGQYLVYWSFAKTFCRLKAVSKTQKVYDIIDADCGTGLEPNQYTILSDNALFLLVPYGKNAYLFHLKDHQREILAPSQREDCIITSISYDGTKFAGTCGSLGSYFQLAVRTKDGDWTIIQPFSPGENGSIAYEVSWSPDGKKLAFTEDLDIPGMKGVYVINDVDQCLSDPSNCPSQVMGPYWDNITDYITWSPDGKQFAVTLSCSILVYNVKTKQSKILVNYTNGLWLHGAAWSPDGKWIGYARERDLINYTVGNIYLVSPNNGTTYFLTDKDVGQVVGWLDTEP